jgi:two-component system response regulator AtoC
MKPELLNILIIDDESAMRHMLRLVLEPQGYRITEAENGAVALPLLQQEKFDAILCDIRMDGMGGLAFLQQETVRSSSASIIMMSAYGSVDTAIECMKLGAYDYISKPFKPDEVVLTLKKTEERLQLQNENRQLKKALREKKTTFGIDEMVFASEKMATILDTVKKLARTDSSVLICGETGTGKELVARALHGESQRRAGPFLAINCSAISAGLLESELFGHTRGAFTGAERDKEGLFAAASGGTLLLDEIAELPIDLQPKLLRVLQEGEIRKVGATRPQAIDTRVIAASGTDLAEAIAANRFRSDLFYRLAVVEITLPTLQERPEDIPVLAEYFLKKIADREGCPTPTLDRCAREKLLAYQWPGNVRELMNFMEKAMIFSRRGELDLPLLPTETRRQPRTSGDEFSLKRAAQRLEQEYIRKALDRTDGNRTRAAELLEISLRSLIYKIKEYDIR